MTPDPAPGASEVPLAGRAAAASLAAASQALRPACRAGAASLSWLLLPPEPPATDFRLPVAGLGEREAQIVAAEVRQGADVLLPAVEEGERGLGSEGSAGALAAPASAPCPSASEAADLWLVALSVAQASFLRALREADEARRHARFWEERGHRLARLRFAWLEQGPLHAVRRAGNALAAGGERAARSAEVAGRAICAGASEAARLVRRRGRPAPAPTPALAPAGSRGDARLARVARSAVARPDPSSAPAIEARALAARARLSRLMVAVARIQQAAGLLRDARPKDLAVGSRAGADGEVEVADEDGGAKQAGDGDGAASIPAASASSPRSLARSLQASAAVTESMRRVAAALEDLAASGLAAAPSDDAWGAMRDRAWNASSWERALKDPKDGLGRTDAKRSGGASASASPSLGRGPVTAQAASEALAAARRAVLAAADAADVGELVLVVPAPEPEPASAERRARGRLALPSPSGGELQSQMSGSAASPRVEASDLAAPPRLATPAASASSRTASLDAITPPRTGSPGASPSSGASLVLVPPQTAREALDAARRAAVRAGRPRRSAREAANARRALLWAGEPARAGTAGEAPGFLAGVLSSLAPSAPEYLLRPAPQTVPPSRLARGWIRASARACAYGAAGMFLYRHSSLSGSGDLARWIREAHDAVRGAVDEHVHKPLVAVSNELFDTFRRRPAIVSMDEYLADRESLARMLVDFRRDHNIGTAAMGTGTGAQTAAAIGSTAQSPGAASAGAPPSSSPASAPAGAPPSSSPASAPAGAAPSSSPASAPSASSSSELVAPPLPANCSTPSTPDAELLHNLRLVMSAYETQLQHVFTSVVTGSLARCLLIQVQKLKVDVESAMLELDQILRANELTTSLLAAVPAIAILVGAARIAARALTPPKPDLAARALPARLALQNLEGALESAAKAARDGGLGQGADTATPGDGRAAGAGANAPETPALQPARVLAAEGAAWLALADAHAAARRAFFPGRAGARLSPFGSSGRAAAEAEWSSLAARLVRLAVPQGGEPADEGDAELGAGVGLAAAWERRAVAARRIGGGYSIYNAF